MNNNSCIWSELPIETALPGLMQDSVLTVTSYYILLLVDWSIQETFTGILVAA